MTDITRAALRRRLHDWRDHWLAESRVMADREAKILTHDVVLFLDGLGPVEWYRVDRAAPVRRIVE